MGIRRSSRATLSEARWLGMRMAASDPAVRPDTQGAAQYVGYAHFVQWHRHYLELGESFEKWDRLLENLVEQEEKLQRIHVHDSRYWDSFLQMVVEPIRAAFWHAWEGAVELQKRYEEQTGRRRFTDEAMVFVPEPETPHTDGSGLLDLVISSDLEVQPSDMGLPS